MEDVHNCVSMHLEVTSANVKTGFIQQILSEYSTLEIFLLFWELYFAGFLLDIWTLKRVI